MRRRPRRDTIDPKVALGAGVLTLGALALIAFLALQSPRKVPFTGVTTRYVELREVGNLRIHSEVRAQGVRIGEVTGVTPSDGRARVRLRIDPGAKIPSGLTPVVRGKGLLGARFVDFAPGGGGASTLSVPDALQTFDGETRGGLRATLNGLGAGVLGRGDDINRIFRIAPPGGRDTIELVDAIEESKPGAVERLIPSFAGASAVLADNRDAIAGGFDPTDRALRPFVDRRAATQATLDAAPPALAEAEPAFVEGRDLLASVRSLASAASDTLPGAPAGLRETTALLREGRRPLARTRPLLRAVRPTVPAVLRITRALSPFAPRLQDASKSLSPLVADLGRYGCDIVELGDNWRSVLNQGVPGGGEIGPLTSFRITALGGIESVAAFSPDDSRREPFAEPCKYSSPPTKYGTR